MSSHSQYERDGTDWQLHESVWLTQPSTLCGIMVKCVSAFWLSNSDGDGGCSFIAAYRRANGSSLSGWSKGRRPSGAVLHSSREPGVQRTCSDFMDMLRRLINCRIIIIIIIIIGGLRSVRLHCHWHEMVHSQWPASSSSWCYKESMNVAGPGCSFVLSRQTRTAVVYSVKCSRRRGAITRYFTSVCTVAVVAGIVASCCGWSCCAMCVNHTL